MVPLTVMTGAENKVDVVVGIAADPKGKAEGTPLVQLKNGKVIFKQKCPSFEKLSDTLQEIVKFREMIEQRIERGDPPFLVIPNEYKPVIAKLAHESDKTLSALTKYIHQELLPSQDEENDQNSSSSPFLTALPLQAIETAIKSVANRNNYGLDGIAGEKPPAVVCVWRWEVIEQHRNWLPKVALEKAEVRISERIQAKKDLRALFEALSPDERKAIIDPKGSGRIASREVSKASVVSDLNSSQPSKKSPKKKSENEENDPQSDNSSRIHEEKIVLDHEKAAREKERLEKKAVKIEKEKKEKQARLKSQSLMANFFGKAKGGLRTSPAKELLDVVVQSSSSRSEFEKTFKPFVVKKDATLAPVNWFSETKGKGWNLVESGNSDRDAIIIDDGDGLVKGEDVEMVTARESDNDISGMSAKERLNSILLSLRSTVDASRFPRRSSLSHPRTYHPVTVRALMTQLTGAEVAGDISLVRHHLSKLTNLKLFPRKVLIFHEDLRPGYFGTWTRNSATIGPRSPFKRDQAVLDYGYDSGEEWEDEGEADDVVDDGDEEDGDADGPDSDMDSWLVDDDEVETVGQERSCSPSSVEIISPLTPPKRKSDGDGRKLGKKRKVVVPLVPFAQGPCWEPAVTQCQSDLFKPLQIQLFNDTPFPIDPFRFVSTCRQNGRSAPKDLTTDPVFAVPSLPGRLLAPQVNSVVAAPDPPGSYQVMSFDTPSNVSSNAASRRPTTLVPKTSFPDAHLPFLMEKITTLATGNLTYLVEAIHQELRAHKVKKNAIEAKIKEVGEKNNRMWVLRENIAVLPGNSTS